MRAPALAAVALLCTFAGAAAVWTFDPRIERAREEGRRDAARAAQQQVERATLAAANAEADARIARMQLEDEREKQRVLESALRSGAPGDDEPAGSREKDAPTAPAPDAPRSSVLYKLPPGVPNPSDLPPPAKREGESEWQRLEREQAEAIRERELERKREEARRASEPEPWVYLAGGQYHTASCYLLGSGPERVRMKLSDAKKLHVACNVCDPPE